MGSSPVLNLLTVVLPLIYFTPLFGMVSSSLQFLSFFTLLLDSRRESSTKPSEKKQQAKEAGSSLVSYRYKLSPPECDHHGRLFGGELLKLIDVSAGLVAAKHAGGPCLTISVDRVIFLQEIRVGDVIHISSAVNRAWGSSMEIGVRVMRESRVDPLNAETYCCHAYLTFVAKPTPPPTPNFLLSLTDHLGLTRPPPARRAQLPEIKPSTLLEQKRYLLAGRRRAHRIQNSKKDDQLLTSYRAFLDDLESNKRRREQSKLVPREQDELVNKLQEEILVEAWMKGDRDVREEGDEIVGVIEGYMDEVRVKKSVVEKAAIKRGHGGWVKIAVPNEEVVGRVTGHAVEEEQDQKALEIASTVDFADTLCMCLWIVRPQHCNSKNILFGGTLMRWVEEVSSIAARRISPHAAWSSAAIDGLTFKLAVQPGWVVYCRAAVVTVWDSSIEVAVTVTCEDRNSTNPTIRPVSDSLFTLVAIDPTIGRPLKGSLRQIKVPEGPASEIAAGSDKRREDRLLDKRVLQQ
ncbi:hypothetical protein JCM5353_005364 [Sporobolomyces roseus]